MCTMLKWQVSYPDDRMQRVVWEVVSANLTKKKEPE